MLAAFLTKGFASALQVYVVKAETLEAYLDRSDVGELLKSVEEDMYVTGEVLSLESK